MITDERKNKIIEVYKKRQKNLAVVLENVHDPHNVSAVLRTCDAVGVDKIYLVYPDNNFPELSEMSSASASKWVNTEKFTKITECYKALKSNGFTIYSTSLPNPLKPNPLTPISLFDLDLTKPTAIVFGNEHAGLTKEALEGADGNLLIPMVGMVQSLNISVSVAVCLYEAMRQRIAGGGYDKSQYSSKEIDEQIEKVAWEKINKKRKYRN